MTNGVVLVFSRKQGNVHCDGFSGLETVLGDFEVRVKHNRPSPFIGEREK
jgi:hypothetical protein